MRVDDLASAVMEQMDAYADLANDAMKKAVRKSATTVRNDIQSGAPVRTGKYKSSWKTKKIEENSTRLEMIVHSSDRYQLAHLLEHGHAKRGGGRVSARVHIAPAEAHGEEILEQEIEKGLRR